jgi:hypothetical protein
MAAMIWQIQAMRLALGLRLRLSEGVHMLRIVWSRPVGCVGLI